LDCPQETRYERIQNREEESIEKVTQKNLQRETQLIERYKEVYPDIVFPPQAELFDLVIDAQNNLPEEIIDIILKHIK
jgi:cytidylate kinase